MDRPDIFWGMLGDRLKSRHAEFRKLPGGKPGSRRLPAWNLLPGPFNNGHPADRMAHSSQ